MAGIEVCERAPRLDVIAFGAGEWCGFRAGPLVRR